MIILSAGVETLTFDMIKTAALVLVVLYALQEVVEKIIKKIGLYTKKEEKIENFDPEKIKTDLMNQYFDDQQKKWDAYDIKITEIEGKIDDNNKEMKEELYFQTDCMQAVIDGLLQLNCNGPVTEISKQFDEHIKKRAYK